MKKFLILIPIILFSIAGFAQNTLNIHQKDGEIFCCGFLEKPIVTYEGNTLKVSTKTVSIEFPLTELNKLSFEDELTDIKLQHIKRESSDILIFNEKGVLIKRIHNDSGISENKISEFPKGIFIIKKGNTTFMHMKRIIRVLMNVIYRLDIFHKMLNKIILVKQIISYLSCLYLCEQFDNLKDNIV